MSKWNQGQESVAQGEHISPEKTGDNIEAKRTANYAWDGSNWQRQQHVLSPGPGFDYIDIESTSATADTLTYKLGGSGGTTVRTLVVTFQAGVEKISDSLASLDFS